MLPNCCLAHSTEQTLLANKSITVILVLYQWTSGQNGAFPPATQIQWSKIHGNCYFICTLRTAFVNSFNYQPIRMIAYESKYIVVSPQAIESLYDTNSVHINKTALEMNVLQNPCTSKTITRKIVNADRNFDGKH